ncbi:MAG: RNA 2',3'-cyclic phosphodiesterase [Coriobacteriia bacterium]|nr:RNA 2',3'-cyclic phosphodiesterase [Coriobacteriia bacterium]
MFIAYELPEATLDLLAAADRAFLAADPEWTREKWVRRDLRHVTVRFLGAVPDAGVSGVFSALREALAAHPPVSLHLSGISAVPGSRRASMLWGTLSDEGGGARGLRQVVDSALGSRCPVPDGAHRFTPHVTLVRARRPRAAQPEALAAARAVIAAGKETDRFVSVPALTLFASTLGPDGPAYESLGEILLGDE